MTCSRWLPFAAAALSAALVMPAHAADARSDYQRRRAEQFMALFGELDRNADGRVTRDEARGALNFVPRFADMDIDRDDAVTSAELARFIEAETGLAVAPR